MVTMITVEKFQYGMWVGYVKVSIPFLCTLNFELVDDGVNHFDNDGVIYKIR